ncbi:hypothetical protein HPB49_012516 [Dermacentor silvarum]|uniref:Uncharacterized protein n=1 Tax=Dermacentor silvarum TaxID=543639 RepID=A0ACB8C934_DERSI|nr:hypothetical protein HPB49_012516 [Dermacentor silvarum]
MEDHEMALLNEPDVTTRRGNSAARYTTPDLSWLSGTLDVSWRCEVDLGSDHSVIGIMIRSFRYRAVLGTARITDWDKKKALQKFTQETATTSKTPYVDASLTHMCVARRSLTRWWKRQRHNRKLAKRIAVLNKQIAEHAAKLCRENWLKTCDGLQGKLLTLLEGLKANYLKREKSQYPVPETYEGPDNEELDRPFTMTELWTAIDESNKRSSAGRDAITYILLGNMSGAAARAHLGVLLGPDTLNRSSIPQSPGANDQPDGLGTAKTHSRVRACYRLRVCCCLLLFLLGCFCLVQDLFSSAVSTSTRSCSPRQIRAQPATKLSATVEFLHYTIDPEGMRLSGAGFFRLDKPLIVSIVGALITFTIILVQTSDELTHRLGDNAASTAS